MKILIVSHEFPPIGGGGANACNFLVKEYIKAGHVVTVLTANYQDMPAKEFINGARIIRVKAKRSHREYCNLYEMGSYLLQAMKAVGKLEQKEKFDICHIFFGIPSGPIGFWLKKKYGVPYVIRFGGGDIPGFQKRFKWIYKLLSPFIKVLWNNADALVSNSIELKRFAQNFYDKKPISVIYNGVDNDFYKPSDQKMVEKKIRILFVSRLIERKGLQHIIPILKEIQLQVSRPISLIVVGDGSYRSELEELVEQYSVGNLVKFVGGKEKAELCEYYQNAEIFILPSNKEGMPNVVLEAMASGLPIVMTPCGGSEELVHDNGYVVSIDCFKETIIKLCNDQQLRMEMGKNSRIIVEEKFGWEEIAGKYIALFNRILSV